MSSVEKLITEFEEKREYSNPAINYSDANTTKAFDDAFAIFEETIHPNYLTNLPKQLKEFHRPEFSEGEIEILFKRVKQACLQDYTWSKSTMQEVYLPSVDERRYGLASD